MLRWTKLIAPVAGLALLIGFHQAQLRADDAVKPTTAKATVTVTVVDSSGKPVAGATVGIYPKAAKKQKAAATSQPADGTDKPARPQPLVSGETAADGTFALTPIPNGDFTVRARLKGSGNGNAVVTIADDKDEAVSVTLKPRAAKN
jgi:5-hydroxyisourate hydrolase-like protein (transthyretin family)